MGDHIRDQSKKCRERFVEITQYLSMHKCDFKEETIPLGDAQSYDYRNESYKEVVPWELRLVSKQPYPFMIPDTNDLRNMESFNICSAESKKT